LEEKITLLEKEFDKHSLNREEKVFFPKLEIFIPREGGPTGLMIAEHKDLVKSIENFKNVMKLKNFEKINEVGNKIISLLRQQIDKENNILFMMTDMCLNDNQKKTLLKKCKEIDSQK